MSDLISRQAAIDAIKEFQHGAAEWRDEQEERSDIWHRADSAIASAIEIGLRVKKLPSAQRTGRWIKHEVKLFNGCRSGRYFDECSECGKLTTEWRKVTEYHRWNFCPNCGARMESEK